MPLLRKINIEAREGANGTTNNNKNNKNNRTIQNGLPTTTNPVTMASQKSRRNTTTTTTTPSFLLKLPFLFYSIVVLMGIYLGGTFVHYTHTLDWQNQLLHDVMLRSPGSTVLQQDFTLDKSKVRADASKKKYNQKTAQEILESIRQKRHSETEAYLVHQKKERILDKYHLAVKQRKEHAFVEKMQKEKEKREIVQNRVAEKNGQSVPKQQSNKQSNVVKGSKQGDNNHHVSPEMAIAQALAKKRHRNDKKQKQQHPAKVATTTTRTKKHKKTRNTPTQKQDQNDVPHRKTLELQSNNNNNSSTDTTTTTQLLDSDFPQYTAPLDLIQRDNKAMLRKRRQQLKLIHKDERFNYTNVTQPR